MKLFIVLVGLACAVNARSLKDEAVMEEVEVPDGMEPPAKPYQEDHEDEMHLGMLGQRAAAAIGSTDRKKEKEVLENKHHSHDPYKGAGHLGQGHGGGHPEDYPNMQGNYLDDSYPMDDHLYQQPGDYPHGGGDYPMDYPQGDHPMNHPSQRAAADPRYGGQHHGGPGQQYHGGPGEYAAARPPYHCPATCDLEAFRRCSCLHPASYTKDGRGNCNVGASKLDLRPWCYIDPSNGPPEKVCPDAKLSNNKKGYFWSRVACITP